MDLKKIFLNYESLLFLCGQVVAGALNYLFQIYCARTMVSTDFGNWSHWLAQFSVVCFAGVWLQSVAIISNAESLLTRNNARFALIILSVVLFISYLVSSVWVMSVAGWGLALLGGFLFGLNLRKKNLYILAAATILSPILKFIWVILSKNQNDFYMAILIAPIASCFIFLFWSQPESKSMKESKAEFSGPMLLSALCLAFFSAWTPQADLIIIARILSEEDFGIYAKVALLSKGFFFCFQILAQLVLVHQVQSLQNRLTVKATATLAFLGGVFSIAGVGVARYFGWPTDWALLSLLHITCLCLMYVLIQDFAALQKGKWALSLCCSSVVFALIFGSFLPVVWYWLGTIAADLIILAGGFYLLQRANRH